jgi:opacity protein-like surface antigen
MNARHLAIFSMAVALAESSAGRAADPVGLYLGGAVGQADVDVDRGAADAPYDVHVHHTAWKAMIGIRPLRILGAELEYLNFGNPSYTQLDYSNATGATGTARTKAEAAFGMLYAPIPIRILDVYGKVGAAHTQLDVNGKLLGYYSCLAGSTPANCGVFTTRETETDFAYGAGVQLMFGAAALRAEYERIDARFPYMFAGDPYMFSFGVTWTFL